MPFRALQRQVWLQDEQLHHALCSSEERVPSPIHEQLDHNQPSNNILRGHVLMVLEVGYSLAARREFYLCAEMDGYK